MGLFDFFRKKSPPKISQAQLQTVQATMAQLQDSVKLVNTTIKPDVFFKRLNFTLDLLLRLQSYEQYNIFNNSTPTQDYNKIINNLEATVDNFIDRALDANKQKIASLKTEKARERNNDNFTSALIAAFDCAHTFWKGDRGFPHYDGPLYTDANYLRVKDLFDSPSTESSSPVISQYQLDADWVSTPRLQDNIIHEPAANSAPIQNTPSQEITPDEYMVMRENEVQWLEKQYDFNTIAGINAIPEKNPQRPPTNGVTGEVYYYLKRKAYSYEESGNIDLALACMRKSVAILKSSEYFNASDCYQLVKMLARAGFIDEAYSVKTEIDAFAATFRNSLEQTLTEKSSYEATIFETDLVIMNPVPLACSECAKYQGRVYSLTGKSEKFPKVPDFYFTTGTVRCGCSHIFWAYIDGVTDPQLDYTLEVHPLQNPKYGSDIVTFSNRPFVDDRTEECKKAAAEALQKQLEQQAKQQYYEDHMIEIEAKRGQEVRDFKWLQEQFPEKCPKSVTGYRRMKTQNTKNYQLLKQMAAELGREI